jgi:AGCS family alanine or glycine:cation symporter
MIDLFLSIVEYLDDFFWSFIGAPFLVLLGIYFSNNARWFQITKFNKIIDIFVSFFKNAKSSSNSDPRGIKPLEAFFASLGGMVGIGNLIGVCSAVQIGGPGAVFWMWVTGFLSMILKYAEIYLGVKYRIKNADNSYDGGPMVFIKKIGSSYLWQKFLPAMFCILLCMYGVEIYVFKIITNTVANGWGFNLFIVQILLLGVIFFIGDGGIARVGKISSILVPFFIIAYIVLGSYVFILNIDKLIPTLKLIFNSAFTGHAALGGFAGSTIIASVSQGVKRACYTGDIGIGYAAIIHSESEEAVPARQASLGITGIFFDTFIVCSFSVLLILITGSWLDGVDESQVVAHSLSPYFPSIYKIWPLFVLLVGYSSLSAFFATGRKVAIYLSPKNGAKYFNIYAFAAFSFFSYMATERQCLSVMSVVGIGLLIINLIAMYKLKDHVKYDI